MRNKGAEEKGEDYTVRERKDTKVKKIIKLLQIYYRLREKKENEERVVKKKKKREREEGLVPASPMFFFPNRNGSWHRSRLDG